MKKIVTRVTKILFNISNRILNKFFNHFITVYVMTLVLTAILTVVVKQGVNPYCAFAVWSLVLLGVLKLLR